MNLLGSSSLSDDHSRRNSNELGFRQCVNPFAVDAEREDEKSEEAVEEDCSGEILDFFGILFFRHIARGHWECSQTKSYWEHIITSNFLDEIM